MAELNPDYIWGGVLITNYSRTELLHNGVPRNQYTTSGPEIGRCSLHHSTHYWHGDTISGDITYVFPTCYVTKSVYDALVADGEYDKVASRIRGVVSDDSPMTWVPNPWYGGGNCYVLKKSKIISVCKEGEKRSPETCWDGSVIHKEVCRGNRWVSTGETCPTRVCTEGAKRSPETCWDGSVIHKEVCRDNKWVSTGETCPTRPPAPECKEGDKKAGYVCSGGKWVPVSTPPSPGPEVPPAPPVTCTEGTYNAEGTMICRGGTWVPVSAPPPECTEGTYNAAGTMICSGGTWVPVSAPPGPGVTPKYLTVSEADERVRMGLPCYIKCTLPVLNMLPGIPYTPGAWIPPFCVITTEQ